MAMHRVFGHYDIIPFHNPELHIPCVGASCWSVLGWGLCNFGGKLGYWKRNPKVLMGSVQTNPMGQGHDGGPLRVHVLVCTGADPATIAVASIAASAIATGTSGVKPRFTAHKVQLKVGDAFLPVCCQSIPYTPGTLSIMMCGGPDLPNVAPVVPTHLSVYAGLTLGDVAGGIIDCIADMYWSGVMAVIGEVLDGGKLAAQVIGSLMGPVFNRAGAFGVNTGPSNVGTLAQRAIDDDGVSSDARPSITVLGLGIAEGADGGAAFATPFGPIQSSSGDDGSSVSIGESPLAEPWSP